MANRLLLVTVVAALSLSSLSACSKEPTRIVCIFFDDLWRDQLENALPVLLEYGFKASFAAPTAFIGADQGTPYARMTSEDLRKLQDLGMDIASHSHTHLDLTTLSEEKLYNEVLESKRVLESLGIEVKTFVYPYGSWNIPVAQAIAEAGYVCARTITPAYLDLARLSDFRYLVPSWPITSESPEAISAIISDSPPGSLIVLTYHHISDETPRETSTSPALFRQHMKAVAESGAKVALLPELAEGSSDSSSNASLLMAFIAGVLAGASVSLLTMTSSLRKAR